MTLWEILDYLHIQIIKYETDYTIIFYKIYSIR